MVHPTDHHVRPADMVDANLISLETHPSVPRRKHITVGLIVGQWADAPIGCLVFFGEGLIAVCSLGFHADTCSPLCEQGDTNGCYSRTDRAKSSKPIGDPGVTSTEIAVILIAQADSSSAT
jgi:hypothetical protein